MQDWSDLRCTELILRQTARHTKLCLARTYGRPLDSRWLAHVIFCVCCDLQKWLSWLLISFSSDSPTDTPPLRCYTCLSKKSWDHCQAKAEIKNCAPDESCLTVKAYHTKKTANNTKEEVVHIYAKYCSAECTKKQCREMGWLCDVSCCSSQECNASVSNTSPSSCAMIASAIALSYIIVHDFFAL